MMIYDIRSRWAHELLYRTESDSLKSALEKGVKVGANFRGVDLRGADLCNAKLRGAKLQNADLRRTALRGADFREATLKGADLCGAKLRGVKLRNADLQDANLQEADLQEATLQDADLRGANLLKTNFYGAKLQGANLCGAIVRNTNFHKANLQRTDLTPIRDDIWAILSSSSPAEVLVLRMLINEGRIDGTIYEGSCACLVGTLAKIKHCHYSKIPAVTPNGNRPAELFFYEIRPGDTPKHSYFSKLALKWVDQWLANVQGINSGVCINCTENCTENTERCC